MVKGWFEVERKCCVIITRFQQWRWKQAHIGGSAGSLWSCWVSLSPLTDGWPSGRACEAVPSADNAPTASFLWLLLTLMSLHTHTDTHTNLWTPPPFSTKHGMPTWQHLGAAVIASGLHVWLGILHCSCLWIDSIHNVEGVLLWIWMYFTQELDLSALQYIQCQH